MKNHLNNGVIPLDSRAQEKLLDWITSRTGLSFHNQKTRVAETLCREMAKYGTQEPNDFRARLSTDQAAFDDLVGELTIGETYFFRDEQQFQLIREDFLNDIQETQPANHQIRVWSAGCASGEEAWSLAITLAESGLRNRSHVLATDISRPSLKRARAGQYRSWSLRGAAKQRMQGWIEERDGEYAIDQSLRSQVAFEYLNLSEDTYPTFATRTVGLDLILCRNVLIYFDVATIKNVAERFYQCLRPGGWLVTGASDPPLSRYAPFDTRSTPNGLVCVRPSPNSPQKKLAPAVASVESQPVKPGLTHRPAAQVLPARPPEKNTSPSADFCIGQVRSLANSDAERAAAFCTQSIDSHPTNVELHYLNTILLAELSQYGAAAEAARRTLFLDRELIVGHMAMGALCLQNNDADAAVRAFRNAERLARQRPIEEIVPLADGERAGRMAELAARHLAMADS